MSLIMANRGLIRQVNSGPGALDTLVLAYDNVPYMYSGFERAQPIVFQNSLYYVNSGYGGLYRHDGGGNFTRVLSGDTYGMLVHNGILFWGDTDDFFEYDGTNNVAVSHPTVSAGVYTWFYSQHYDIYFTSAGGNPYIIYTRTPAGVYTEIDNANGTLKFLEDKDDPSKILYVTANNRSNLATYQNGNVSYANIGYLAASPCNYKGRFYLGDLEYNRVMSYNSSALDGGVEIMNEGAGRVWIIQEVYDFMFIVADSGIYKYDGTTLHFISAYLDPFFNFLAPLNGEIYLPCRTNKLFKIV